MRNLSLKIIVIGFVLFLAACGPRDMGKATEKKFRWPLPPEEPRIEFIRYWSGEGDFDKKTGFKQILLGSEESQRRMYLMKPYGVASDSKGNVIVCDTIRGRVFYFDTVERKVRYIGLLGPGALRKPIGVTVGQDDNIWVVDAARQAVIRYAPQGDPVSFFGALGELENPTSVALDEERGKLYVADSKGHKINVYDIKTNALLTTIGERGQADGQFNYPINLTVDHNGYLYVVDSMNFRIQVFDSDGVFDGAFGGPGDSPGSLARPRGIAVDPQGNIFVADALHESVQIFNSDFELLMWIGGFRGLGPGEFFQPSGLWISQDKLYVSDSLNHRVQVFKLLYLNGANNPGQQGN